MTRNMRTANDYYNADDNGEDEDNVKEFLWNMLYFFY